MDVYSKRKYLIIGLFSLSALIIVLRLFYIQVVDSSYKISADNNVLRREVNYPARGVIYDRNGKLLVFNQAAYDVLIIPREVKPFDTLGFCSIVGVDKKELVNEIIKAKSIQGTSPHRLLNSFHHKLMPFCRSSCLNIPDFIYRPEH